MRSTTVSSSLFTCDAAMQRCRLAIALALALALGACATAPGGASPTAPVEPPLVSPGGVPPAAGTKPGQAAPPATPLATEQRWMEDWFRGTPVVIAVQNNSVLQVDVPLANSFDAGKSDIKPALAAVLERVSESLRRQVGARITVSTPGDPGGAATLAQARATKVREHLVARRIAMPRISIAEGARAGGPVQLRLAIPALPIARLDDSSLAVPAKGVKPVAAPPRAPAAAADTAAATPR